MFTAYEVFLISIMYFRFCYFVFNKLYFTRDICVIIIPKTKTFFSSSTTNKKVAKMHLEECDREPIEVVIDVRSKLPMLNHKDVSAGHHLCEYISIIQSNT